MERGAAARDRRVGGHRRVAPECRVRARRDHARRRRHLGQPGPVARRGHGPHDPVDGVPGGVEHRVQRRRQERRHGHREQRVARVLPGREGDRVGPGDDRADGVTRCRTGRDRDRGLSRRSDDRDRRSTRWTAGMGLHRRSRALDLVRRQPRDASRLRPRRQRARVGRRQRERGRSRHGDGQHHRDVERGHRCERDHVHRRRPHPRHRRRPRPRGAPRRSSVGIARAVRRRGRRALGSLPEATA